MQEQYVAVLLPGSVPVNIWERQVANMRKHSFFFTFFYAYLNLRQHQHIVSCQSMQQWPQQNLIMVLEVSL